MLESESASFEGCGVGIAAAAASFWCGCGDRGVEEKRGGTAGKNCWERKEA